MSLNWNFNTDKIGTWKETHKMRDGSEREFLYNIYSGNALAIMVAEWNENGKDLYQLVNFFADKDHMKNCLGLTKGYEGNIFQDTKLEIELYAEYRYTPFMVQQLAKANFDHPIKITVIPKAP